MGLIGISGKIGAGKDTVADIIKYLTQSNPNSNWEIKRFAGKLKQIVSILTGCRIEDLEDQEFKSRELGSRWLKHMKLKSYDELNDEQKSKADKSFTKFNVPEDWVPTYRWLLQKLGTEVMREQIHENIWVNALFSDYKPNPDGYEIHNKYKSLGGYGIFIRGETPQMIEKERLVKKELNNYINSGSKWIISDLRFPNELEAIEDRDGITIRVNKLSYNKLQAIKARVNKPHTFPIEEHPSETALDNAKFKYTIENNGTMEELVEKVREILIKEKII